MQYNYYNPRILILLSALFICIQCDLKIKKPDTAIVRSHSEVIDLNSDRLPKDFGLFYDRFHTDDDFQMAHITWPLSGNVIENDNNTIESSSNWTKEDWTPHRKMPSDGAYDLIYSTPNSDYIQEIIMNRQVGHGILRRWRKINDQWFLTYYSGMLSAETLEKI